MDTGSYHRYQVPVPEPVNLGLQYLILVPQARPSKAKQGQVPSKASAKQGQVPSKAKQGQARPSGGITSTTGGITTGGIISSGTITSDGITSASGGITNHQWWYYQWWYHQWWYPVVVSPVVLSPVVVSPVQVPLVVSTMSLVVFPVPLAGGITSSTSWWYHQSH